PHDTLRRQGRPLLARASGPAALGALAAPRTATTRPTPLAFAPSLVDRVDQDIEHLRAAPQGTGTGAQSIHDQQRAQTRLVFQEPQQRPQPCSHLLPPSALRFVRGDDNARGQRQRVIERRQEAALAILEQLIERAPRSTRAGHYVGNSDVPHTVLTTDLDHRREHPPALDPHKIVSASCLCLSYHHATSPSS